MKRRRSMVVGLIAGAGLCLAGCVIEVPTPVAMGETQMVVTQAPPPARVEVMVPAPSPLYIWAPGCWLWRNGWVWQPGQWVLRPHGRSGWAPAHWQGRGHEWRYAPGHWR